MAIWSSLCRTTLGLQRASQFAVSRYGPQNASQIRQMSGHAKFQIQASRWQYQKFKDLLHFYLLIGAIPLGLVSLYANVFIGPAQLAPIPEGYKPEEHEYYRHPISRFFMKYLMESEQVRYERHMHFLWQTHDEIQFRKIEKKVKDLQEARADYKYWYYVAPETKSYEDVQQDVYEMHNERPQR